MEEMKLCTKCGKVKPLSEFGLNKSKKDGHQCHCKECVREYKKKHYQEHKEDYLARNISYREKQRDNLDFLKSKLVCSKCGESRWWLLDFHHLDPTEKEGNISHLIDSPIKLEKELEKCIVLCANCHRDLHYQEKHKE